MAEEQAPAQVQKEVIQEVSALINRWPIIVCLTLITVIISGGVLYFGDQQQGDLVELVRTTVTQCGAGK